MGQRRSAVSVANNPVCAAIDSDVGSAVEVNPAVDTKGGRFEDAGANV